MHPFEKGRSQIKSGKTKRAGLLGTQGIRGGANREILQRIKETGDVFFAQSDRNWILDGATVHVSMVGFDNGSETNRILDCGPVTTINANLTSTAADTTKAVSLNDNLNIAFMGTTKRGSFDIPVEKAREFLRRPNPHGKPNSDVLTPFPKLDPGNMRESDWPLRPERIRDEEAT